MVTIAFQEGTNSVRQYLAPNRLEKRSHFLGRLCRRAGGERVEVPAFNGDMSSPSSNRPHDGPRLAIDQDFGSDEAFSEHRCNPISLIVGRKSFLAEAIPDQTAKKGLATRVADALVPIVRSFLPSFGGVGRPKDVQPRSKLHLANQLSWRAPNREAPNPKPRLPGVADSKIQLRARN